MTTVMGGLQEFFIYVLIAAFVQNSIFSKSFGVSRTIKLLSDDNLENVFFCGMLCIILVLSAPLVYIVQVLLNETAYAALWKPLVVTLCVAVVFILLMVVLFFVASKEFYESALSVLPLATFNCAVFGPLFTFSIQEYNFVQSMGFALGSALGYALALFLIELAQHKLNSLHIPSTFRGLPIHLIYIGIISIVVYGLSGYSVVS